MTKKKTYEKPKIIHREKVEVLAAVCDSNWIAGRTCMTSAPACQKTRF